MGQQSYRYTFGMCNVDIIRPDRGKSTHKDMMIIVTFDNAEDIMVTWRRLVVELSGGIIANESTYH